MFCKVEKLDITFREISPNNSTEVIIFPVHMNNEFNIKVISNDSKGKILTKGGVK